MILLIIYAVSGDSRNKQRDKLGNYNSCTRYKPGDPDSRRDDEPGDTNSEILFFL